MSNDTTLSWTSSDPLQSQLFSSWGTLYRFDTSNANGKTITTLYRAIKQGKEDKIARLEWGANGKHDPSLQSPGLTLGTRRSWPRHHRTQYDLYA